MRKKIYVFGVAIAAIALCACDNKNSNEKITETAIEETTVEETTVEETTVEETTVEETTKNIFNIPENLEHASELINVYDLAGSYTGTWGNTAVTISIDDNAYEIIEDSDYRIIGYCSFYVDSKMEIYGGNRYEGFLREVDTNVYKIECNNGSNVFVNVKYDDTSTTALSLEMWIDNEQIETCFKSNNDFY